MAFIGIAVFLTVWAYSFWQSRDIVQSLLAGLTLAMSILPEEIPVAFTTFMALGSWKLMKQGVIIKRSSIVETLEYHRNLHRQNRYDYRKFNEAESLV